MAVWMWAGRTFGPLSLFAQIGSGARDGIVWEDCPRAVGESGFLHASLRSEWRFGCGLAERSDHFPFSLDNELTIFDLQVDAQETDNQQCCTKHSCACKEEQIVSAE